MEKEKELGVGRANNIGALPRYLLDSSLITTTNIIPYDIKAIDCGEYCQVYIYKNKRSKKRKKDDNFDLELTKFIFEEDNRNILNKKKLKNNQSKNIIDKKNIIRSKLECQRLAKTNISDWETFITLTFKENIIEIDRANKRLRYFIDKVRRIKPNFKFLCIPEFQKRGAVHYHMLTNISIDDSNLIFTQENNSKYKHIKYWKDGFTSVEVIKGDPKKIIGYISKYMTKDIDNRLFGKRRYHASRNLNKPKSSFINLDKQKDNSFYKKLIQDKDLIYQNNYINPYDRQQVVFLEFLKK